MNWTEIKSTLVRRWPDVFKHGDGDYMESVRNTLIYYHPSNLSDIDAIRTAIGQWIWSDPMAAYPKKWWGMWWDRKREKARHTQHAYDSRAEAELAALGEWLKSTEDK